MIYQNMSHLKRLVLLGVLFLVSCNPTTIPQETSQPISTPTPVPTETMAPATRTSTPTKQISPSPVPTQAPVSVEIIGLEETVYSYASDRCADGVVPDLPVRVFRDALGMVQLNLSSPTNYRMIGPDLDSLTLDCDSILTSDQDTDPSQFNFQEWIGSTYTTDGQTVYALIHNEYHGGEASTWDSSRDFFDRKQGANDWNYQSWSGSSYRDMTFSAQTNPWLDRWQGPQSLCQIFYWGAHPDLTCQPTRTWTSPVNDTVTITGGAWDSDPNGGNGVIVTLLKGEEVLWSETIENGNQTGFKFNFDVPVQTGERIHFRVDSRGDSNNDSTGYKLEINVGPDPCDEGLVCNYMSITHAVSSDGGQTFTQPSSPDHLVASLPIRYQPNVSLVAYWQPSNIVKSPKDGYYYALFELDINQPGSTWFQGTCVMRTQTLEDPKSWRAWDGQDFQMRFINPYLEPEVDPSEHICETVPVSAYGALSYNLTWNSYLEKFVAVGHVVNHPVTGFYFSLSDDLIHWTPAELLMEAEFVQTTDGPYLAYPSLVDPDNTSLNFDVTGQRPYLYFSRFQRAALEDIDLLRIRIEFNR